MSGTRVVELLANSLSAVQSVREDATRQLEQAAGSGYSEYVDQLVDALGDAGIAQHLRLAAGVNLKNTLTAKDAARRTECAQRWLAAPAEMRQGVKQRLLQGLSAGDERVANMTAQVIGAVAAVEIPAAQWGELVGTLLGNMQSPADGLRIATLQAIGYTCEGCAERGARELEGASDQILTAIVQGAHAEEPNHDVRLAAMDALYNSLEFVSKNFEVQAERDHIMQVVCQATTCPKVEVQICAYEALVKVMHLHYGKMVHYMERALYGLTVVGMRSNVENVALQAIEFWSTVCDEELDLMDENEELINYGEQPTRQCYYFSKLALNDICPTLLSLLLKHEEDDDDAWTVFKAAATCLSLLASVTGDDIVPRVLPFVQGHIGASDWHGREAAVMAFGSIIEGPQPEVLGPIVQQAIQPLIRMMDDPVAQVRDTTAWALGRIAGELHDYVDPERDLPPLVAAVCAGLGSSDKVASSCAWCLMNLGEKFACDPTAATSPVSQFTGTVVQALLQTTVKSGTDRDLRASAYGAMAAFVANAAVDCLPIVHSLTEAVCMRLQEGLAMQNQLVGMDDREAYYDQQASLCSVLAAVIRRLGPEIQPLAYDIMSLLLRLLQSATRTSTVTEDVLLAVGNLAGALNDGFEQFLEPFLPFLVNAIHKHEEIQTCAFAIGLVGDISRALDTRLAGEHCSAIMTALATTWNAPGLHHTLKPLLLTAFGDVALAVGPQFEPYLQGVMGFLSQAVVTHLGADHGEGEEFLGELKESVIQAFVGIIQGLKGTPQAAALLPFVPNIIVFSKSVAESAYKDDALVRALVGLVGDIAEAYPASPELKALFQANPWIEALLREIKMDHAYSSKTKEVARWARTRIREVASKS